MKRGRKGLAGTNALVYCAPFAATKYFFHLIVGSVVKNRVEGEGLSKSTDVNTATVGQQQVDDVCGKKRLNPNWSN